MFSRYATYHPKNSILLSIRSFSRLLIKKEGRGERTKSESTLYKIKKEKKEKSREKKVRKCVDSIKVVKKKNEKGQGQCLEASPL